MLVEFIVSVIVSGVLGFLFHGLRNNKSFIKPVNRKRTFQLGFLFDIFTAIIGALFMILVVSPTDMSNELGMFLLKVAIGASLGESLLVHLDLNKERMIKQLAQEAEDNLNMEVDYEKEDGNEQ